ncbi:hypothetical protein [Halomonas citrativorans]|uniref:ATPase n=1 Tax=Halomonas citrativorans TaxID=2742612 RepID=A0ABR9FG30_9GAMM|nr:hypothetical protein [Halomonas citrativorans]MBE0405279.1 hypothetical protein [Halomonas citrativorans]
MANLNQPQWGWACAQSIAALDFWAEFEPGICFLLLTVDPQEYLAQCLLSDQDENPGNERVYLERWQAEHEQLLAFYLKNPERCLLVNASQVAANPVALMQQLAQRWQFSLDSRNTQQPVSVSCHAVGDAPNVLARYVATKILQEHSKLLAPLYDELQAAQHPVAEPDAQIDKNGHIFSTANISLSSLLKDYQRRCERDLSEADRKALEELKQENELLLLQLNQMQDELEEKKHLPAPEINNRAVEEARQESELLLLQLHQVQEELEHYFLQNQKTSDELTQLKKDNRKLKHQNKLANEQAATPKGLFARKAKKAIPSLEFEGVQLCHEQVNPDYEHLWISLQSPCFGERLADQWHFRIACAGVKPGEFGQQPKLELPEQNDQLLAQWFSESESEHGHKLELRFALPNAMDTGVWKQISSDDQQLIKALLQQLPDIISELKNQNTCIHRNWGDWEALIADMYRINEEKG